MLAQEEIVLIKGKRSKRPRPPSPLASTMASSSSTIGCSSGGRIISDHVSGGSSSTKLMTRGRDEEEEDMANCLILLAKGQTQKPSPAPAEDVNYQCKTCNRSFSSFQALGGHRASHNKPINKSLLALEEKNKRENSPLSSQDESTVLSLQIPSRISGSPQHKTIRVHECSICGAEFSSGQALGGHMRRHRPLPEVAIFRHVESRDQSKRPRTILSLDLNLPAPEDDHDCHQRENKFTFTAPQESAIVFSATSLVDCHY